MTGFARRGLIGAIASVVLLSGCTPDEDWEHYDQSAKQRLYNPKPDESVFGGEGLSMLFGSDRESGSSAPAGSGIAVNAFLWRASLDTVSFLPLSSADPFGGVIITDWYAPPESPDERFKMTVYILGRTLRADALRVALFRQERDRKGEWVYSEPNPNTRTSLENKILERARQLRIGVAAR